mmetsp:Transcript_4808/g.9843  ORF Transcript_4808/g.9843 Transcript_4808/m.9843 type:complete len:234 (-) Transcript_4808:78-779(-)
MAPPRLRFQLVGFVLCAILGLSAGGVSKEVVGHVQCAVCEMAMEEVHSHASEKKLKDEDSLSDLVDGLCSIKKEQGKWVSKVDITREGSDGPLRLEREELIGFCKSECLTVQRACQADLKGKDEQIVSLLMEGKKPAELKKKVCKKICDKKLPKLGDWTNEPFRARDPKEVEAEERVAKMEAETGQKYKMWHRDEIASMSQADIELEAAKDALHAQRREAKLAAQAEAGELEL